MKTGCIQHPQNAPLLIVHQWQVDSLNGDVIAAKLMSFFEYWHSHKLDELLKSDKPDRHSLIQHHTEPELEAALFVGAGRKAIGRAIKTLLQAGVVELRQNPRVPQDRTRHFLFIPEKAQELADRWNKVYQAHFAQHKGKAPICIPGNLSNSAIGQNDDCKTQNSRLTQALSEPAISQSDDCKTLNGGLQNADVTIAKRQMASCKTPNGVDPKITSEITSEEENPPLPPNGGMLSPPTPKIIPVEQTEQPEECFQKLDSPKPYDSNSTGELHGSGENKYSGVRPRNRKSKSKAGSAERIYRWLEGDSRYEADKFYQWFEWYKRRLCEPYGKAHGDKARAAESWMNLVENGVSLQQVSAGSTQYLGWVRANPDRSCEIPHAHNFLEGKVSHPTPYWQLALEDATAAPVANAEFVAEPAPTMTRQDWAKRLGALLRETGYLLPDASRDCPGTRYVTSARELSADELQALVTWLETPLSARRSA